MKKRNSSRMIIARSVVSIALTAVIAVLFNFLPEKIGTYRTITDSTTFTPLLAPSFSDHLLGLNLWWGLSFTLYVILLWTRRWTPALRWAEAALELLGAYELARLVIASPFLPAAGGELVRYLLAFVVLGMIFTSVHRLNKLVNGRWLVFGSDPAR